MSDIKLSFFERIMRRRVQHYDPEKYWRRRNLIIDPNSRLNKIMKSYFCYYIKKCDAFNNASTGAHIGFGADFATIPNLPHGLYGIIISHNVKVGKNSTIYHQVTIGEGRGGAPQIGDNCTIGAGAKLLGNIKIGNNVMIGAGAVVTFDVPDNSIVKAAKGTVVERTLS